MINRIKAEKFSLSEQRLGLAKFKVCVLTCSFGIGQTWSLKEDADYFEIEEKFNK